MARNDNDDERLTAVNVQVLLEQDYYERLVARGEKNDRSARREATRILKAVIDGNIQFVDPVPVQPVDGACAVCVRDGDAPSMVSRFGYPTTFSGRPSRGSSSPTDNGGEA